MTVLLLLLGVGALGAAGSAWGLGRGDRARRAGAVVGGLALVAVLVLALALEPGTAVPADPSSPTLFAGHLATSEYLRLTIALWALDAWLIVFLAWLIGGLGGLRGLLPATLAAIVGATVALASADATLGAGAAGATGLAAMIALVAAGEPGAIPAAARELRVAVAGTALLVAVTAVAPSAAVFALRAGSAAAASGAGDTTVNTEAGAVVGLLAVSVALAIAVRIGLIPFHVRIPRLADAAQPLGMPLLLVWIPIPFAIAALTIADQLLAPLALPLIGEQWVIVGIALVTLVAAALAAFIQDDLRHAAGYLIVADGALVLLPFAALDPAAWGPARTWLLVFAASKTALAAWTAVMEDRFGTRSLPDLRGWLRRSPMLAAGLLLVAVATFGLPGWVAVGARADLGRLAAGPPWDAILVLAGFATLPTYLRLLALGGGPATSMVSRAAPERIVRRRRVERLPVVEEGAATGGAIPGRSTTSRLRGWRPSSVTRTGAAAFAPRLTAAMRRDATELAAAAVLALAVLAALTSWGALDIGRAAAEPAPISAGPSSD